MGATCQSVTLAAMSRHHRVLVVEDEPDIALLIKHTLERAGEAEVETVPSGDEALRAAAESRPDWSSSTSICRS